MSWVELGGRVPDYVHAGLDVIEVVLHDLLVPTQLHVAFYLIDDSIDFIFLLLSNRSQLSKHLLPLLNLRRKPLIMRR